MALPRPWQIRLARRGQSSLMRLIIAQDKELLEAITKAARQAQRIIREMPGEGIGAVTRQAFYQQRRAALLQNASQLWGEDIPRSVQANLSTATQMAVNANYEVLQLLGRATPRYAAILQDSMLSSARRTFQDVRSRMLNSIDLSPSVYRNQSLMAGKIDDIVNNGIALGQSAKEIADAVYDHINPSVMGGQRYAAHRLGRTELNNAFHTTSIRSYAESPYVEGVQWELSSSHPEGDICDELAEIDEFGLGPGVFPPDQTPFKPHPNCFCFLAPVTPTPEQFADQLTSGEYDCAGV